MKDQEAMNGYNWEKYTACTAEDYRKARATGDFSDSKGHCMLEGGELEIKCALNLAKIYLHTEPEGKVLDVASGSGYMAHCWKKLGFEVTGIELLQEGVALARDTYPDINFCQGDGTAPKKYFEHMKFNVVFIREFHPFTRIDDFDLQIRIIEDYLDIMHDGGVLIIDQSRRRDCPNLNMEKVRKVLSGANVKATPPLYFFPHKHLKITSRNKSLNKCLSRLTDIYSMVTKKYPVQLCLIHKCL
ncbi:MAG: class I SAM-dependent methyltransferase [Bacteroidia bacterium]|nr:class I SAM-dependent methyltransferase [Bacteroidia bacterium]